MDELQLKMAKAKNARRVIGRRAIRVRKALRNGIGTQIASHECNRFVKDVIDSELRQFARDISIPEVNMRADVLRESNRA